MRALDSIDRALAAAVRFLLSRQSPDGAWRSSTYGVFRDGDALTPLVLHTLLAAPDGPDLAPGVGRGAAYLAAMAGPGGGIDEGPQGLAYPVYTAALAVHVLSHPHLAGHRQARDAWLSYLRQRQLTEALDWRPEDRPYGGWGYAHTLPRKPKAGAAADPCTESNLSATVFALEALCAAGVPGGDPLWGEALTFVRRCQNWADDPKEREPAYDDGGFFFIYDDPVRNKAGVAGTDRSGCQRFRSYGSTTADGLRALRACGLPSGDARVKAARRWLERHFSASVHPGRFAAGRAAVQASVYYYYCRSLARALAACGPVDLPVLWTEALSDELRRRQRPDGPWVNDAVEVREDDPLVATALAAGALAVCRAVQHGDSSEHASANLERPSRITW